MPYFDIALILIIFGFEVVGWKYGLVHALGSILGTIVGIYLASRWYAPVANWLINATHWSSNFSRVVVFIIVFLIINRLVGIAFWLIDKALSIITRLPIIHGINKLLGFGFGIIEGVLVVGIILFFINKFPLDPRFMAEAAHSKVAPFCVQAASILWPLIPSAIKSIKDYLPI